MAQETNEYRENRLASLKALAEMGFTPYGHAYPHEDLKAVRAGFEEGKEVSVAGRLLMIRRMGKMNFCTLNDGTDQTARTTSSSSSSATSSTNACSPASSSSTSATLWA